MAGRVVRKRNTSKRRSAPARPAKQKSTPDKNVKRGKKKR
jgi:hypothetical protein